MSRPFFSRRNRVCLIESGSGPAVEKIFSSPGAASEEAAVYRLLEGSRVRTASLLKQEENRLLLSFLAGEDYLSLLERQEREDFSLTPWTALTKWLADFHRATGLVQRDMNLRNFLWHEGAAAGLDFEDCAAGEAPEMAFRLAAFVLLYDPPGTETKKRVVRCIQSRAALYWQCAGPEFAEGLARERKKLLERRQKKDRRRAGPDSL